MSAIILTGHGYRIAIDPDHGASILSLTWQNAAGQELDILRQCDDSAVVPGNPSPVGCFPMAPFANRIDGGRFTYDGSDYALAVNQPSENVAIHGLSRFARFEMLAQTPTAVSLLHHFRSDVFNYDLSQHVAIDADGVAIELTLVNRGDALPFGIGLHPYFTRELGARLRFAALERSQSDARHLPLRFVAASTSPDFNAGAGLDDLQGLDANFSNWGPRHVALERPGAGLSIAVTGSGAFTNLHVYVGPDRDHVCIEPVSHVPDVHNRRDLARYGDVARLQPGEALTGTMRISVSWLQASKNQASLCTGCSAMPVIN
jgi:aldose 1-epimerase